MSGGYSPGHPWYYRLGGPVLGPKSILLNVIKAGYQGYAARHISEADGLLEPQRSSSLRTLKTRFEQDLREDLARYRDLARTLRRMCRDGTDQAETGWNPDCVFTAISLKHNHIFNDLGHLRRIDELLSVQGDLFG